MKTGNSSIGVCMIKSLYHPYVGGAEKQVERLSKELHLKGVKVFLITRHFRGLSRFEIISEVPVYRVPTYWKGLIASLSFIFFSLILLFKKRKEYQIIHAHIAYTPAIIAVIGAKIFRKKCLVKIARGEQWGEIATLKKSLIGRPVLRFLKRYMDVFIAISKDIETELNSVGIPNSRIYYIPNGVDTEKFRPLALEKKFQQKSNLGYSDKFIVSFVGRLDPVKGIKVLLKAWKDVVSKYPNAYLLIIGSGPQKNPLIEYAKRVGVLQNIEFIDETPDVYQFLSISDLFVLPSLSEGVSNALLEAMSCNLPVIATSVGGSVDLIEDGANGVLVHPKDSRALTESILHLIKEDDLRLKLGDEARKSMVEKYSFRLISSNYINLYKQLVNEGR